MYPHNVFLKTTLIFGFVWAVRAAFGRLFAALDSQVIFHVAQPPVSFITVWTLEVAGFLVHAAWPLIIFPRQRINVRHAAARAGVRPRQRGHT